MKKILFFLAFIWLSTEAQAQTIKPCEIFGTVCFVQDKFQADFSVYIEETESFATVRVFREDNALYADQTGVWFITNKPAYADYLVYVETIKGRANFTIYYTDTKAFAGCN
ncbi:MAG: DUF6150 family protein [Bacteroidota bacterium]